MANRYKIFLGLAWVSRNNLHHQSNQPPTPAHNHQSTITNTCNHLPPPFISSLTSVTHQLVSRLHGSLHWSMSACLPVHPGTRPYLWKRKFTYSDTVHPASSALFIISLMLEALPELCWINYLLIRNYLSVSLTSMWQWVYDLRTISRGLDMRGNPNNTLNNSSGEVETHSETAGKGLIQDTQAEDQEPDNKATRND